MKTIVSLAGLVLLLARVGASAQVVADGATNTLSRVTNTLAGDVTVGTNGAFTLLVLSNQTLLTNATHGVIGRNAAARSNDVHLLGPGTRWLMGTSLLVGSNGSFSQLLVSHGAFVLNDTGEIGRSSPSNRVVVAGPGSAWTNAADLMIGRSGSGNLLVISNGGAVRSARGFFGISTSATNNMAVITDAGSVWDSGTVSLGDDGSRNQVMVTNGGALRTGNTYIGAGVPSSNNLAVVTGPGSWWMTTHELSVGHQGQGNRLHVLDSGAVSVGRTLYLGANPTATNSVLEVNGGSVYVTNTFSNGVFTIRRGTNVLNAGRIEVDELLVTNMIGRFEFNGGTLSVRNTRSSHMLRVGNGVSPATLHLKGNGLHTFNGVLALNLFSNATLTGSGTIGGRLTIQPGAVLSPGVAAGGFGTLVLSNSPLLQGATILELDKNAASRTNDAIRVLGTIDYDGSLTVQHLGPTALAAGDRFQLFAASSYAGAFDSVSLPALGPGLNWNDRLLVDGSIEVVAIPSSVPATLGALQVSATGEFQFSFSNTPGTMFTVLASPDPSLPAHEWTVLSQVTEILPGQFRFTDLDAANHPRRFYRVRSP